MDILEMPSQHLVLGAEETGKGEAQKKKNNEGAVAISAPVAGSSSSAALMLEQALAITEAAIVVYDVRDATSFRNAWSLYELLRWRRQFALLLVGCKSDADDSERCVAWNGPFLEASAKTGDNVSELFACIGREILRQRQLLLRQESTAGGVGTATSTPTGASLLSAPQESTRLLRMENCTSSSKSGCLFRIFRTLGFSFARRPLKSNRPVVT